MTIKIIKIDGEFAIVELENGERKICPIEIFPRKIKKDDYVCIKVIDDFVSKKNYIKDK